MQLCTVLQGMYKEMTTTSLLPLLGVISSVDLQGELSGPQVFPTTISNLESVLKKHRPWHMGYVALYTAFCGI